MNPAIMEMLSQYRIETLADQEQALRQVLQEVTLTGLWRTKFFEQAAFYGGTALRILYGLDRFSEDLDFTLLVADENFSWEPYAAGIERELAAFGFEVTIQEKKKSQQSAIKSAFLKANTLQEMLKIGVKSKDLKGMHPESLIRIKVEIDTQPNVQYGVESKFLEEPIPATIRCVRQVDMFAGKMHAALYRAWRGRVKGRDWYDVLWFVKRGIPLNLLLFSQMMGKQKALTTDAFREILKEKITSLDMESAKNDILQFARREHHQSIQEVWSKDFFQHVLKKLEFVL